MKSKQFLTNYVMVTTLFCTFFIMPLHLLAQKGEMPITTSSKEALKLFSAGVDKMENIERAAAVILFDQAIEKDPEFALAYLYRAHAGGGSKVFHQNLDKAVSLIDSTLSTVANTSLGNCDGIARDVSGNYFVSAWSQQSIYKFDNNLTNPVSVVTGLSNPADIVYNLTNDTLAVPNSQNNTVTYHSFSTVGLSTIPSSKNSIIAYPNPSRDEMNISFTLETPEDVALYLYNSLGQLVFQTKQNFDALGKNEFTFSTADLPAGSYNYVLFLGGIAEKGSVSVVK